jgi:flagellar biosynthesis anti-sigma factor FlgM
MNIQGISSARNTQLETESVKSKVSSNATSSARPVSQDRTTLHSDSTSVQSLAATVLQSPEVRQDKVDSLRASVRGDEYQIDASRLADAISGSAGR